MEPFISSGLSAKPMTMRDYFGDSLGIEYYYRHPRSYVRRGIFSIDEPSPTVRGVNRPMPEGYKIHANDPVKSKEGVRSLDTKERSYIQTFPRDFVFEGSKTDLEQMIGNAVPVNLAKIVATAIAKYIATPHQNRNLEIDFDSWELEERLAWCASEPQE
jgi:DNA (cytosine-5)-methyltransferase 1